MNLPKDPAVLAGLLAEIGRMLAAYDAGSVPLDRGHIYRLKDSRQALEEQLRRVLRSPDNSCYGDHH